MATQPASANYFAGVDVISRLILLLELSLGISYTCPIPRSIELQSSPLSC